MREPVLQAYCCLAALEGTANLAEKTLDGTDALDTHELKRLGRYFTRVGLLPSLSYPEPRLVFRLDAE